MTKIIIVPHTHWDREWYLPFERYRYFLVQLVDEVLALLAEDENYTHFLLDGQVVLLEDYQEIKPEQGLHVTFHNLIPLFPNTGGISCALV